MLVDQKNEVVIARLLVPIVCRSLCSTKLSEHISSSRSSVILRIRLLMPRVAPGKGGHYLKTVRSGRRTWWTGKVEAKR